MADSVKIMAAFEILPYTEGAMNRFEVMKKIKPPINVRGPDMRIGSIALVTI